MQQDTPVISLSSLKTIAELSSHKVETIVDDLAKGRPVDGWPDVPQELRKGIGRQHAGAQSLGGGSELSIPVELAQGLIDREIIPLRPEGAGLAAERVQILLDAHGLQRPSVSKATAAQ